MSFYYSVVRGFRPGVYHSWDKAKLQVDGFSGAVYKKFKTFEEATFYLETGGRELLLPSDRALVLDSSSVVLNKPISPKSTAISVFTDGSATRNGKHDCKAAYAVYFGHDDPRNECGQILKHPSNQRAELHAIIRALEILASFASSPIVIYTDSQYAINCFTKWISGWKRNGFLTASKSPVKHADLLLRGSTLLASFKSPVEFCHVDAHTSPPSKASAPEAYRIWRGNYRADKLAKSAISS